MGILQDLVVKGDQLLNKVVEEQSVRHHIRGELVSEIKSLHVQGRFLLRGIDKVTYEEYSTLFSQHVEQKFDYDAWNNYVRTELENCLGILKAIQAAGPNQALDTSIPRIFISHGKFGPAFSKLEAFTRAIGCDPVYDAEEPTEGRSINEHVESLFKQADFYVILATYETSNRDGVKLPNHNVMIEFDRLKQSHMDKMVVLLEEGCKMPSMVQEVIYAPFESNCMDQAFTKLAAELSRHGLLK